MQQLYTAMQNIEVAGLSADYGWYGLGEYPSGATEPNN